MEYQYPFAIDWSTEEVIEVVHFFQMIEKAYENGVIKSDLMNAYRKFKIIVPSKSEEKKLCNEFEEASHYSAYRTLQVAKSLKNEDMVKMENKRKSL